MQIHQENHPGGKWTEPFKKPYCYCPLVSAAVALQGSAAPIQPDSIIHHLHKRTWMETQPLKASRAVNKGALSRLVKSHCGYTVIKDLLLAVNCLLSCWFWSILGPPQLTGCLLRFCHTSILVESCMFVGAVCCLSYCRHAVKPLNKSISSGPH